jgi:hypothetical protein
MAEQTTLEVKSDEIEVKLNKIKGINKQIDDVERWISILKINELAICSFNTDFYLKHDAKSELYDQLLHDAKNELLRLYEGLKLSLIKEAEALMK